MIRIINKKMVEPCKETGKIVVTNQYKISGIAETVGGFVCLYGFYRLVKWAFDKKEKKANKNIETETE